MSRNAVTSWLAVIQFVAILQIFVGLVVLPAKMHSGDSAILDTVNDAELRSRIERWHHRDVQFASRLFTGFGIVVLVLGGAATWFLSRASKESPERLAVKELHDRK